MASNDGAWRPSSGRWTSSPKGPWTPAFNAITPNNTTHRRSVANINDGPSSSTIPASSGQLTYDPHSEKHALHRALQQQPKKRYREPNPDIGVLQPIPSTECSGLPPATGVTLTSGITIRRGHGEQLDPTELSPSPFAVPNWDELGSVVEMQSRKDGKVFKNGCSMRFSLAVLTGGKNTRMSQSQRWSTTMDLLH